MRIEMEPGGAGRPPPRTGFWRRTLRWAAGLGLLVAAFLGGVVAHKAGWSARIADEIREFRRAATRIVSNPPAAVPTLVLDMPQDEFKRIAFQRARALEERVHLQGPDDWAEARLTTDEGRLDVKVRLKGATRAHWERENQWSLSFRIRGDHTWNGMKRFTAQHPRTRDWDREWLFQFALGREGLIRSRVLLARIVLNGIDQGLYLLEEHYDKRLLEHNRRRAGPILGFNKDAWLQDASIGHWSEDAFWDSPIEVSRSGAVATESKEFEQVRTAVARLAAFRSGKAGAAEVFDVERLARAGALRLLLDAAEFDWRDLKFYLDPVTGRLEPVDQEINQSRAILWWRNATTPMHQILLTDRSFVEALTRNLERMATDEYLQSLLTDAEPELNRIRDTLRWDYPEFSADDAALFAGLEALRESLAPPFPAHAYLTGRDASVLRVEIAGRHHLSLEVLDLVHRPTGAVFFSEDTSLVPRHAGGPLVPVQRTFTGTRDPGEIEDGDLALRCRVPGSSSTIEIPVYRWRWADPDLGDDDPRRIAATTGTFEGLLVDTDRETVTVPAGDWEFDRPLVTAAGQTLILAPGARIALSGTATIVAHGPIHAVGTATRPIVIEAAPGIAAGLLVLRTGGESRLEHVILRGLSPPARHSAGVPGAVTFYESPVLITDCTFEANAGGDDCLNLVRTRFEIRDSVFSDCRADAIDIDFCEGSIRGVRILRPGNDGLDTSGSVIAVEGLQVEGAGDKALSAGEGSTITASAVSILGGELGLTSKDSSVLRVDGVLLDGVRVGLVAFRKKPEFTGGRLEVRNLTVKDVVLLQLIEKGSLLVRDGVPNAGLEKKVESRLYGEEFGRSSR